MLHYFVRGGGGREREGGRERILASNSGGLQKLIEGWGQMERLEPTQNVYAATVEGKGRGVFARRAIKAGELIERCPVIVCPGAEWELLEQTALRDYYLNFGEHDTCILLGFGELYNHGSDDAANARTVRMPDRKLLDFVAIRDIQPDEEITFTYQCGPWW